MIRTLPRSVGSFLVICVVALALLRTGQAQQLLAPLDDMNVNASRAGIVDVVNISTSANNSTEGQQWEQLGFCHIALVIPFTVMPPTGRLKLPFVDDIIGGMAAAHLALDMLNKGDGSIVSELEGLPQRCPIRFTSETLDSTANAALTVDQVNKVLQRTTPIEREVCAFIGANRSPVTLPMAILTGLANRPQLTPWAVTSQFDDKNTFPLLGRLITSELGQVIPLLLYLKSKNVNHLGLIIFNNSYGKAYVDSLLQQALVYHEDLKVFVTEIPLDGATPEDYEKAIDALVRSKYRWFFCLFTAANYYVPAMNEATKRGISGPDFVWMFNSGTLIVETSNMVVEKGSDLHLATHGIGSFSSQNGRPGIPEFDRFAKRWQDLANSSDDLDYLTAKLPEYTEPDFLGPKVTSSSFGADPSIFASTMFDETIMLGLAACAAADSEDSITVDGNVMFQHMLSTTFQGATGKKLINVRAGR